MLRYVKSKMTDHLLERARARYELKLNCQKTPYLEWIKQNEKDLSKKKNSHGENSLYDEIAFEQCTPGFKVKSHKPYVLFYASSGILSARTYAVLKEQIHQNENAKLLYADEDYLTENNERTAPWFKPEYSPDTIWNSMYFGHLLMVDTKILKAIEETDWIQSRDGFKNIYLLVLQLTAILSKQEIMHVSEILFHNQGTNQGTNQSDEELILSPDEQCYGTGKEYQKIKEIALKKQTITASMKSTKDERFQALVYEFSLDWKISVIIPSKDHATILRNCISSIYTKSTYQNFEIIVVDNGSNEENKDAIQTLKKEFPFTYLYEEMDFNFSKMCNIGVKASMGDFIVLLNDDCEVIQQDWLERMLGQAALEHVGAVGAKLLYPKDFAIQHVGVTNLSVGPAHKLAEFDDQTIFYHGMNKINCDMIAVTAACLMISKEKYQAVGGFYEGLKVAYNDVDFCFHLIEKGWYNVQRNDVELLHYESLSRGNDEMNDEKWDRLLQEKALLYERHPHFYKQDPFYSKHLVGNAKEYLCNFRYDYEKTDAFSKIRKSRKAKSYFTKHQNGCLIVTLEHADLERKLEWNQEEIYLIEGWAYVLSMDNARYKKSLVLISEDDKVYEMPVFERYRKDVVKILPEEKNVALAGFVARFPQNSIPNGQYEIVLQYQDTCSRQCLVSNTNQRIQIQV